jgi:hypothetical protein
MMNRRAAALRKICRDAVLRKIRRANRDSNYAGGLLKASP